MKRKKQRRAESKDANRSITPRPLDYSTLSVDEKDEYGRSIDLLYDLRQGEDPYTKLLRKHRLNTRKAHRYLGSNLIRGTRGKRVRASKTDRLVREVMFPTRFGDMPAFVRGSRAATKLSNYFQDREKLLRNKMGSEEFEAKWRDVQIDGREVFADADEVLRMANADIFQIEHLYASVGSAE
jgi:hypothetical protein